MADYSVAVVNAWANAYETTIGASPVLEIRSGAKPADCAAADSGTVLASIALPADWMVAAVNGVVTLLGSWQDASADAPGTAAHYRIKQGATCHEQGTVTLTGGGGDMTLDNTNIASSQQVTITSWQKSFAAQL